jgi:hypothetical protein
MQWYMIKLAYLGSQYTKFNAAGCHAGFLHPFIWSYVSGLTIFCVGPDKGTASYSVQIL